MLILQRHCVTSITLKEVYDTAHNLSSFQLLAAFNCVKAIHLIRLDYGPDKSYTAPIYCGRELHHWQGGNSIFQVVGYSEVDLLQEISSTWETPLDYLHLEPKFCIKSCMIPIWNAKR